MDSSDAIEHIHTPIHKPSLGAPLRGCNRPPPPPPTNRLVCNQVPWGPQVSESQAPAPIPSFLFVPSFPHLQAAAGGSCGEGFGSKSVFASLPDFWQSGQDRLPPFVPRGRSALARRPPRGGDAGREGRVCHVEWVHTFRPPGLTRRPRAPPSPPNPVLP